MSLTIPENRALKRKIAIPSPIPFGRLCTVQVLDTGAQLVSCSLRAGVIRTSVVTGVDGGRLTAREITKLQPKFVPVDLDPSPGLEKFEQSRTMVAQFTSDGTTGDIEIDMGNAPFNGNIISVQVEVSEALAGSAALAVRSDNGQSVFQGTGVTEGGVLGLEPDFVAVGLFADPLFVPVSNIPVIAGEGISLVMRLAGTVVASAVRAFVSVTLQGVGEDLSKKILLRAAFPAPAPAVLVAESSGAAPVPGESVVPVGIVSALVRFPEWSVAAVGLQKQGFGLEPSVFRFTALPAVGSEWSASARFNRGSITNLRTRGQLRGIIGVTAFGENGEQALASSVDERRRRKFLTGATSDFRALEELAEVEFILDSGESLIFGAGGVPTRFQDEFGARL